ncbi:MULTISPECIES: hypothetical protein [unclassified Mycobacterium]|uniref:hypothetical protein n=1 Tax=unclassified Mycobacterium TaxID=2642494 RepID=UPI0029C78247|nr:MULTISPECIES: hypothetical protein [unclassified Mycobacterium]
MKQVTLGIAAGAVLATWVAPTAAADATTALKSEVDSARAAAGCPPLQSDPILDGVAQRANSETDSNILHTARFIPFEDPMPVLRDLGYNTSKAKMLVGYGDVEAKANRGVVVEGYAAIPDCSYTKYGVNALSDGDGDQGYVLAAVVLAGP